MGKSFVLYFFLLLSFNTYVSSYYGPSKTLTLVSSVSKNTILPVFSFTLNTNEEYFLHIGGPYVTRRCTNGSRRPIIPCNSQTCELSRKVNPHQCSPTKNKIINKKCSCQATAFEPFQRICKSNQFTFRNFTISSLNPSDVNSVTIDKFYYLCIPTPFLRDFPPGVFGVAGLAPTALTIWSQFSRRASLGLEKKFAFCLPSSENVKNKGVIYFGGGSYNLGNNIDARSMLSYTPLLKNPKRLNNYFLKLKDISINSKKISIRPNIFDFDRNGDGGMTLSTVTPFTVLRSDVYKVFIDAFSKATSDMPRVNSTLPFEFCVKARKSFEVPMIGLEFDDGKIWKMLTANSMKKFGDDVACLAIVDGGVKAAQAVVIGMYQMENVLMEFDVGRFVFGFSSSLGLVNASCGDFQTKL